MQQTNPHKKVNQTKRSNLFGSSSGDDEIDLDDMLSTSQYIYLEDQVSLDKYENILSNFEVKVKSDQKVTGKLLGKGQIEESKSSGFIIEDKENISVYSNNDQNKQKTKNASSIFGPNLSKINGSILRKAQTKKRDVKRMPLSQIEDDDQNYDSDTCKLLKSSIDTYDQEGTA